MNRRHLFRHILIDAKNVVRQPMNKEIQQLFGRTLIFFIDEALHADDIAHERAMDLDMFL